VGVLVPPIIPQVQTDRVADLRRSYTRGGLAEGDLAPTWAEQFARWFSDALAAGVAEPNAVVLGTADADGQPSGRTVLLKGYDDSGLVVYTNLRSRKGREVADNPRASLVFPWVELERQVVVIGAVSAVPGDEADAYFASRPRGSQLGAWASDQSSVVASRAVLDERAREVEARFGGQPVPRPPYWGGLRVVPATVEFWQGRPDRLHDRLRFRRSGADWLVERLAP